MRAWIATAQLFCVAPASPCTCQSASLQSGAISLFTPEILGMWSSWCRLGQGQYMGLSLKTQKPVSSHFSSGNAQINLILHPAMARPEMPFPEEFDELGKPHPAAPWGAEGRANPCLAEQGASKQKAAVISILPVIFSWGTQGQVGQACLCFPLWVGQPVTPPD